MKFITQNQFDQAFNLISSAKRILLVSHKRPDGDTLGASAALHLALEQLNKKTTLACIDEIPQRLQFIPATEFFVKDFNMNEFDLIIISDAGAHHMTGFHEKYPDFLSKRVPIINIDHHASNENFGTVNIVHTDASSATMIIWEMLKLMSVKITKEIAFSILTGIYNDTGGFVHSNTTKETFEIAAELARAGVKPTEIVGPLFKRATFSQLKLWGYILENMRKNESQVLSSVLCEKDFWEIGAYAGDTGGIIDLMNTVPDAVFSMLLVENEGWVKGSLRTQRNDVNVSDIAGKFGGGGHPKAAGFRIHGRLEKQNVWKILI